MINNFHRYLNLPFEIKKPNVCETNPNSLQHRDMTVRHEGQDELIANPYVDENVTNFFESLGICLLHIEAFYTPPGEQIPIHTDDLDLNHVKINKTWGPEEGTVRWWKSDKTIQMTNTAEAAEIVENDNNGEDFSENRDYTHTPFLLAKEEDSKLVYEKNTNKTSLLNVGELHSTYNPTDEGRWTICFVPGFKNRTQISFEDAIEIFKDYIEE